MTVELSTIGIKVQSDGIKQTADGLESVYKAGDKVEKKVESLTKIIEKMSTTFLSGTAAAKAYSEAVRLTQQTTGSNDAATAALTQAIGKLTTGIQALNTKLAENTQQVNTNRQSLNLHTNAMQDAHAAARGLSGSLGALWMTYGNLVPMLAGIAVGATLKGVVSTGKDIEHTLEGIRVKGVESVESIDKIRESVIELGKGVYAPIEVAKAFETLILAGLNAKQALVGISDALNLATVGGTSIEKSAHTLVQVGTALGYTAESYGRISDVIAMTAAVSMSSVESLSEAFKSGSVVGKLYGVTLVDIGTSLAALSNLGIQGSAAGTSLKNFYKELASSSDKVKSTLKDMHMVPEDFKDAQGNYLGVLQVVEKLATGLGTLTEAQGKLAIANLSNERGMKTAIELLDLYKQKVDVTTDAGKEHSNMLAGLREKIEESYGFAAIGAAAMSLTVESQFKSVANTLQTTFLTAFKEVSPQLNIVATRLKEAFNSPEFAQGIQTIATAIASLTVTFAENIPTVIKFIEAILLMKTTMFVVEFLGAVSIALKGVAAAAALANIPLIPLTAVLLAAGAAYLYFTRARDDSALSDSQKSAIQYTDDYSKALDKEATRLTEQLRLMKENKSATDAQTESLYAQQLAMAKMQGDNVKKEAQAQLDKAGAGLSQQDRNNPNYKVKHSDVLVGTVSAFQAAQDNLVIVTSKVDANFARIEQKQKAIMQAAKDIEVERLRLEKEHAHPSIGTGMLSVEPDAASKKMQSAYESEKLKLEQLIATYSAREEAVRKAGETEVMVMSTTYADREKVYLKDKHLLNSKMGDELMLLAVQADQKKFDKDKADVWTEFENKIGAVKAASVAYYREQKKGSSDTMGALERELEWRSKLVGKTQEETEAARAKAREADKENTLIEARKKLNSATGNASQRAATMELEADTMLKFMNVVKASPVELAKLEIEKLKLTDATAKNEIALRMEAASLEALDMAYRDSAKIIVESGKQVQDAQAEAQLLFASSESEKVRIKSESTRRLLAYDRTIADNALAQSKLSNGGTATEEALKQYKKAVEANEQALTAVSAAENAKLNTIKLQDWKKTVDDIEKIGKEGFTNMFEHGKNGWREMTSSFQKMFKTTVIDYIYKQLMKPFVLNVIASVTGAMGMTGLAQAAGNMAGASSTGSSLVGAASAANSLYSAITDGFASVGTSVANGVQSGLNFLSGTTNMSAGTMPTLAADGSLTGGEAAFAAENSAGATAAGATASYAAGMAAGKLAGSAISGEYGIGNHGSAVVNIGTVVGAIMGGPIGGAIGGAIGGLANRLFGMGKTSVKDEGIRGTVSGDSTTGEAYQNMHQNGGLFRSDKNWTTKQDLPPEIVNSFSSGLTSMKTVTEGFAKSLDISSTSLSDYSKAFDIQFVGLKQVSGTAEQQAIIIAENSKIQQDAVTKFFTVVGDEMANKLVPNLSDFARQGESAATTLQRLSETFKATDQVISLLGTDSMKAFGSIGLASDAARERLIALSGGLQSLSSKMTAYMGAIYTDAQKLAPVQKAVSDAMTSLGVSSIVTKAQYKEFVDKLVAGGGLMTEAGTALFNNLMELAPAFGQVADAAEQAAQNAKDDAKSAIEASMNAVDRAYSRLQTAVEAQKKAVNTLADADIAAAKVLQEAAKTSLDAIKSVFDALTNALKSTKAESALLDDARRKEAVNLLKAAMSMDSLVGVAGFQDALDTLAKPSEQMFSTFQEYAMDQAKNADLLKGLQSKAGSQVSLAQRAIDKQEATIKAIEESRKADLDNLDKVLTDAQAQIDGLKGIDNSVLTVAAAIANLQSALTSALGVKASATLPTTSTGTVGVWSEKDSGKAYMAANGGIPAASKAASDAAAVYGDNAYFFQPGKTDYAAKLAAAKATNDITHAYASAEDAMQMYGHTDAYWKEAQRQYDAGLHPTTTSIQGFDVGTNYLPSDMIAKVHEGERIVPKADNLALMRKLDAANDSEGGVSNAEVVEAINKLADIIVVGDVGNIQITREMVKLLRKFDQDGLPETRSVAA